MTLQEHVDKQYEEWLKHQDLSGSIDEETVKSALVGELEFLSKMSVEEYTLWRKWDEIQRKYPSTLSGPVNPFFEAQNTVQYPELQSLKSDIWIPNDPMDFAILEPRMTLCDTKTVTKWNTLRTMISTMINNANIGRQMFFIVDDKKTGKLLGVICVSGDFLDMTPRDNFIGWTREQRNGGEKRTGGMLNHTAIGSTIVPTQPLGQNYLGGKLMSLLTCSIDVENSWNNRYKEKLIMVDTTSLYGSFSQYNNLQYWNKRGHTAGSIKFEPTKETVNLVKDWLKYNYTRKYFDWYHATKPNGQPWKRDHKQRSLAFTYSQMKIPKELYETDHQRGIYTCHLFTNACEFLRQEITEDKLIRRFDNSVESLVEIWKTRYAKKRVEKMVEEGKFNRNTLFYDGLIGIGWDEAKERYLGDVGR